MSRQNRGRIVRGGSNSEPPVKFRDTSGATVNIAAEAAKTLASAVISSPDERVSVLSGRVSVAELRDQIGYEGLRAAAVSAGRKEPSMRTLQRWVQRNAIPHAVVVDGAQRRAAVSRLGGVQVVAQMIQRDPSSVYRWQAGQTKHLRGPAGIKMGDAKTLDALARAGAFRTDGTLRKAGVRVVADADVRYDGNVGYEFRERKLFRFAEDTTPMAEQDLWQLAYALAQGQFGVAVGVIERHASTQYPDNQAHGGLDRYDDGNGYHLKEVHSIDIDWLKD